MSEKSSKPIPSPDEVQREVQQFLQEKYGSTVVMAQVDSLGQKETTTTPNDEEEPDLSFDMTPEELESYLHQYVVQQDEAVEILATKVATHFNRMRWEHEEGANQPRIPGQIKPNILMIGPTGVGKTYIIRLIAERLGVPFVKGDATKFSETGYVGGDVEDLVRDLVRMAKGDIRVAEYGIIYIDEIDKIAASQGFIGPDVSRTGVQRNLLKLMEETDVELRVPHDLASQMEAVIETQKSGKAPQKKVNTKNILFIVSGAFNELEDIIRRRLNRKPIGFGSDIHTSQETTDEILDKVSTQDLIEYGFESEFIGRLPVLTHLRDLDEDGLFEVLTNEYNAVIQGKIRDFAAYGIELEFTKDALRLIAESAHAEKTGARGLTRVVEKSLIPFEKRMPSTSARKFVVTREIIEDPRGTCKEWIYGDSLKTAIKQFENQTGIILTISPAAKKWLQENPVEGKTPGKVLLAKLEGYEYGFNLLKRDSLQVTAALLEDPKDYLEQLIKKSYREEKG